MPETETSLVVGEDLHIEVPQGVVIVRVQEGVTRILTLRDGVPPREFVLGENLMLF